MKHFIIVKFRDRAQAEERAADIQALFEQALAFDGVHAVKLHWGNSERANRYHLMIEMGLTPKGLEIYDGSEMHRLWKETYGPLIEAKAIFDCE